MVHPFLMKLKTLYFKDNNDITNALSGIIANTQSFLRSIQLKNGALHFTKSILKFCPGGGVHNMLRVRVCAAYMGGFLGPKFSKQGSLFRQIFLKQGGLSRNRRKIAKNGWFSAKFHHKIGYVRKFR